MPPSLLGDDDPKTLMSMNNYAHILTTESPPLRPSRSSSNRWNVAAACRAETIWKRSGKQLRFRP